MIKEGVKKLIKNLIVLSMSLLISFTCLSVNVNAASYVGSVYSSATGKTDYFTSLPKLWKKVDSYNDSKQGASITVEMLKDWNLYKDNDDDNIQIPKKANVTINMNGHMIDRGYVIKKWGLSKDDQGWGDGQAIYVNSGATLTINGGDATTTHTGFLNFERNGGLTGMFTLDSSAGDTAYPLTIYGALITGGACNDKSGAGAISVDSEATVKLNNLTIAGNIAASGWKTKGGAITVYDENATLTLNGVTIAYNYAKNDGGGIYVWGANAIVNIKDSHIHDNSTGQDGGGIFVGNTSVSLTLDNTIVENNKATRNGGGVELGSDSKGSTLTLKNSAKIQANTAKNNGGGIYMHSGADSLTVTSSDTSGIVNGNACENLGGGIYDASKGSTVNGLDIDNNVAAANGGGIHVNNTGVTLSNLKIRNNKAKYGGGVYVGEDDKTFNVKICTITGNTASQVGGGIYTKYIKITGTNIIKDNKGGSKTQNLYLTSTQGILGVANYFSEIYISTPNDLTNSTSFNDSVVSCDTSYRYLASGYFSDQEGVNLRLKTEINTSTGEYKYYLYRTFETADESNIKQVDSQTNKLETTTYTYKDKTVYKGYISHSPSLNTEDTDEMDSSFYYSDGYFLEDSSNYNTHLSSMSLSLTMAGFSSTEDSYVESKDVEDTYTFSAKNVKKLYSDLGFSDVYICDYYGIEPHLTTFAWSFATKTLDDGSKIVTVVCRGAGYGDEWYSNVLLGEEDSNGKHGEHKGFSDSATLVYNSLQEYIKDYGLTSDYKNGNIKFWVTGYSRGAAVANLTSKRIVDGYIRATVNTSLTMEQVGNKVYAYCFAAPKGGINDSNYNSYLESGVYNGIHNVINDADIVPKVAFEEMGYIRYGIDHYVPGTISSAITYDTDVWSFVKDYVSKHYDYKTASDNNPTETKTTDYYTQRSKMLDQLYASNPKIDFTDDFSTATINIYGNAIAGKDMITKVSTSLKVEQYEEIFTRALQAWGFKLKSGTTTANNLLAYAREINTYGGMSLQDALLVLMSYYNTLVGSDTTALMKFTNGLLDRVGTKYLWYHVIGCWNRNSKSENLGVLNTLWTNLFLYKMEDEATGNKVNLLYYLTGSNDENTAEAKQLKNAMYVILDTALRLFTIDSTNSGESLYSNKAWDTGSDLIYSDWVNAYLYEGILTDKEAKAYADDADETYMVLGTFAYNVSTILMPHTPEVTFAWVRSYDSYYDSDTSVYQISNKTDYGTYSVKASKSDDESTVLTTDTLNSLTGKTSIVLDTTNTSNSKSTEGALIEYKLYKDGESEPSTWSFYNDKAIDLDYDTTYILKTRAMYLQTVSTTSTYKVKVSKATVKVSDGTTTVDVTSDALNGSAISVDAYSAIDNSNDTYQFTNWVKKTSSVEGKEDKVDTSISSNTSSTLIDVVDNNYTSFTYEAKFVKKVTSIDYTYNANDGTYILVLKDANGDVIDTTNYTNFTDPVYSVGSEEYNIFTVGLRFYEDKDNGIYFSKNVTGTITYELAGAQITTEDKTYVSYEDKDGSVYLSKHMQKLSEEIKTLTINYVSEDSEKNQTPLTFDDNGTSRNYTYTGKYTVGSTATVVSPVISGYKLKDETQSTITKTISNTDADNVVTVVYEKTDDSDTCYKLEIQYLDGNDKSIADTVYTSYKEGTTQIKIPFPNIAGYVVDADKNNNKFKNGYFTPSQDSEYTVVQVYYKANSKQVSINVTYKDAYFSNITLDTTSVSYAGMVGNQITLTPASQQDTEEFVGWSLDGTNLITSGDTYTIDTNKNITFTVPSEALTLYALYRPIVTEVNIGAPDLDPDKDWVTSTTLETTLADGSKLSLPTSINWYWQDPFYDPDDESTTEWTDCGNGEGYEIDYNQTYKAVISIDTNNDTYKEYAGKFTISDNATATINGKTYQILKDENGNAYVEYLLVTKSKPASLVSVTSPSSVSMDTNSPSIDSIKAKLPTSTTITYSDGTSQTKTITWNDVSYTRSNDEQNIAVIGSISSDGIYNPNNVSLEVSTLVYIPGLARKDAPSASPATGEYTGSVEVTLSGDGDIYYATEIDTELNAYTKYTGPIKLEPKIDEDGNVEPQIIYAYVKGDNVSTKDSIVVPFTYTVKEAVKYTVTYKFNNGQNNGTEEVSEGSKLVLSTSPTRTGFIFKYWVGSDGNTYNTGDDLVVNSDITLSAMWTPDTSITFKSNISEGKDITSDVLSGSSIIIDAYSAGKVNKSYYQFTNWVNKTSIDSSGLNTKLETSLTDNKESTITDAVSNLYNSYTYEAKFVAKVSSIDLTVFSSSMTFKDKDGNNIDFGNYDPSLTMEYVDAQNGIIEIVGTFFPDEDKNIYFSDSITGNLSVPDSFNQITKVGTTSATYNPIDGSVTLRQQFKTNAIDSYKTVTIKYIDINSNNELSTSKYYFDSTGQEVSISASPIADEAFYAWSTSSNSSDIFTSSTDTYTLSNNNKTISFKATDNITLYVFYQPVVKNIEITTPDIKIDEVLPTTATTTVTIATIENTYNVPTSITWKKYDISTNTWVDCESDEVAEYDTTYKAILVTNISSMQEATNKKFTISDAVSVVVNGITYASDSIRKDADGNFYLEYTKTSKSPTKVYVSDGSKTKDVTVSSLNGDDITVDAYSLSGYSSDYYMFNSWTSKTYKDTSTGKEVTSELSNTSSLLSDKVDSTYNVYTYVGSYTSKVTDISLSVSESGNKFTLEDIDGNRKATDNYLCDVTYKIDDVDNKLFTVTATFKHDSNNKIYYSSDVDGELTLYISGVEAVDSTIASYNKEDGTVTLTRQYKSTKDEIVLSAPKSSYEEGTYVDSINLTLSTNVYGTVYYTLDGSDPTTSNTRIKYNGGYITLDKVGTCTLKTYVSVSDDYKDLFKDSAVASYSYTIRKKNDGGNSGKGNTCEETIGPNWTWSEKTKTCIYKVRNTNTSIK